MDQAPKSFLEIAELILEDTETPLSSREIVALAVSRGMLVSTGKTPWQTMKSKLSMDVLRNGDGSRFMRTFQGLFTLRRYGAVEYKASRYVKNKLDEDIAVIKINDLPLLVEKPGYIQCGVDRSKLSSLAMSMGRRAAEENFSVVQLVSVFIVHHNGKFLTHMRSARLPESRLHGEYSVMLGGHVSVEDFAQLTLDLFPEESLSDCSYILRELSEELVLETAPSVVPRGYIYDVSRDVSRQHLGLVYLVDLKTEKYEIGERGFLMNSKFESALEISSRINQFENWSIMLLQNIDKIIAI